MCLFIGLVWPNWPMVWKLYVSTTAGLFFCSFPLENCHFPQPLETSCLIDLSVLCIGPWLGQFVTLILNLDFFFFFFMETCLAINLFWRDYQILSCKPDMNALSLWEQLHTDKSISKNKCPSVSKTCLISASSILNLSIGSVNSV